MNERQKLLLALFIHEYIDSSYLFVMNIVNILLPKGDKFSFRPHLDLVIWFEDDLLYYDGREEHYLVTDVLPYFYGD